MIQHVFAKLNHFLYEPASPRPLAALRIGIALTLLLQAVSLAPSFFDLYGSYGILQEGARGHALSVAGWLRLSSSFGIAEETSLVGLGVLYVLSLVALTLGWKTRAACIASCLFHVLLTHTQATSYGLDQFAQMSLFLLIWSPCGAVWSIDALGIQSKAIALPSARLLLRVFQLYLCIAYLASGVEKARGTHWWNGEAIWRTLTLPVFAQFEMSWLAEHVWLAKLACWGTLIIEIGYAVFIWPRLTRKAWVALTIALHLGIGIFMGLWLFALIMILLTFSVFGVPAERSAQAETSPAPHNSQAGSRILASQLGT